MNTKPIDAKTVLAYLKGGDGVININGKLAQLPPASQMTAESEQAVLSTEWVVTTVGGSFLLRPKHQ